MIQSRNAQNVLE